MELIWPLADYIITRNFAYLSNIYVGGQHAADDLIRKIGTTRASPILSVAAGTVVGVGWDMYSGFFVAIDHAGGWRSFYRHLYGQSPVVVGQVVVQGQIIGNVGNTGWSTGDHLHFDLWSLEKQDPTAFYKNGWWAHDPELYLGKEETMTPEDEVRVRELIDKYAPYVQFKPTGHSGAALKTWISSYHTHRKHAKWDSAQIVELIKFVVPRVVFKPLEHAGALLSTWIKSYHMHRLNGNRHGVSDGDPDHKHKYSGETD